MRSPSRVIRLLIPVFSWISLIILPHFLSRENFAYVALCLLWFVVNWKICARIILDFSPRINVLTFFFIFSVTTISILFVLSQSGVSEPYLLFSRLGSYTMFLNGHVFLFGDLAHLTSAAQCVSNVSVGEVLCDPWGRAFNQNPDVVYILRLVGLHNTIFLGISITIFSAIAILFVFRRLNVSNPLIWLMLISPPMVLALDRGNEILTLGLLVIFLFFWVVKNKPVLAMTILFLAGIYKLWPFLLLFSACFLKSSLNIRQRILFLLAASVYLFSHFQDLKMISDVTQLGDFTGGSFGFKLYDFSTFYSVSVLFFGLLLAFILFQNLPKKYFVENQYDIIQSTALLFMIGYLVLFFLGIHFTYRLLVLIPLSILLSLLTGSRNLIIFIFVTLFMSRLPAIGVATTSLAVVFLALIFRYMAFKFSSEKSL